MARASARAMHKFPIVYAAAMLMSAAYALLFAGITILEVLDDFRFPQILGLIPGFGFVMAPMFFLTVSIDMTKSLIVATFLLLLNAVLIGCGVRNILEWMAAYPEIPGGFAGHVFPYIHAGSILLSFIVWDNLNRREQKEIAEILAARRRSEESSED
jgi:hypothetical protein